MDWVVSRDSFVSGLEHSYRIKFDRDMHPMLMEWAIAADLKVPDNFQRVFLMGNSLPKNTRTLLGLLSPCFRR